MTNRNKTIAFYLGAFIFISELSFGIWMTHWNHFIPGDAISRVANAYYVLFSRNPHLGAIGFVWNPLPSLLMLPIILFSRWVPQLASEGIAGIIVTAFFAAGASFHLFRCFIKHKQQLVFSLFVVLLFAFNPFIFLYGSNGMSEILFIYFLIFCLTALLDWLDPENGTIPMIMMGFSLALAFFTRYESIIFGVGLALSLTLINWFSKRHEEGSGRLYWYQKWEATELIVLLPAIYSGIVWFVLNWSIMGDGFFFLRSNYSNLAQSEGLSKNPTIGPVIGDFSNVLIFVVERSLPFLIPFLAILIIRTLRRQLFKIDFLCLILLIMSIPIMQTMMLYRGASYGWLRFFAYPMPIVFAWLPYELQKLKELARPLYVLGGCITLILLSTSAFAIGLVMNNQRLAPEEYEAIHYKESPTYSADRLAAQIAHDLDTLLKDNPNTSILVDSFNGFRIILTMKQSGRLVITSDLDFEKSLKHPVGEKIDYILVPKPEGVAALNAVNQQYKNFYNNGADFAQLDKQYGDSWRLYQVVN
ncbi:hypothetical protein [Sporolactobacillus terrae]|uniref:hypothetical protein n=1 Tax=Sporolactobacillus terrae TaxID=269673 RepID=UPI00111B0C64|nr:hypothetical protein [Sporolactobacillus terrae]